MFWLSHTQEKYIHMMVMKVLLSRRTRSSACEISTNHLNGKHLDDRKIIKKKILRMAHPISPLHRMRSIPASDPRPLNLEKMIPPIGMMQYALCFCIGVTIQPFMRRSLAFMSKVNLLKLQIILASNGMNLYKCTGSMSSCLTSLCISPPHCAPPPRLCAGRSCLPMFGRR